MNDVKLPPRAEELIKCFVGIHERVEFYLDTTKQQEGPASPLWITQLCAPTYQEVDGFLEDAASVYTHPSFIRLLYQDDTYEEIRARQIRLVEALDSQNSREVVEELLKHLDQFTAEDRARSFLLLASGPLNEADGEKDGSEERTQWLDQIVNSFEVSPRHLRPQLLLAASIIGHELMVTLLLRDLSADNELAPNIDAVEAECLIEAATNQRFAIVKELLDGGRFSNGNETRWDAVVQALEASCANGATDIVDILLPHYVSYCSVVSACGLHHPRFIRLALSNWHFEIVELLLESDLRGTICNMMELMDTLREEVAGATQDVVHAAVLTGILSVVGGEEKDDRGDLVMWDTAALARGISSKNIALVRFLVNYILFSREALEAALKTAQEIGYLEMVGIISSHLQKVTSQWEDTNVEDEEDEIMVSLPSISSDAESGESQTDSDKQSESDESDQIELDERSEGSFDSCDEDSPNFATASEMSRFSRSTESLEALRTASLKAVEQVLSSASRSVTLKSIVIAGYDLVQMQTGTGSDTGADTCDDGIADLQYTGAMCSREKSSLLRHYSSKTVDYIVSEGKLAATSINQDIPSSIDAELIAPVDESEQIDGDDENRRLTSEVMENTTSGSVIPVCDQASEVTTIDLAPLTPWILDKNFIIGCEAVVQYRSEEREFDEIVTPVEVTTESSATSSAAGGHHVLAKPVVNLDEEGGCEQTLSTEKTESHGVEANCDLVESDNGNCGAVLFDNNILKSQASEEDDASERQVLTNLVIQKPTPNLPCDQGMKTQEIAADVGENGDDQDKDGLFDPRSRVVSDQQHIDTGTRKTHSLTEVQPRVSSTATIYTPSASPTRATIVCPVKWVEHTTGTSETSALFINTSPSLNEGDRVEVHYKGRSVLFTGVIIYCHSNDSYDVVYEDGEEESCVPREFIQLVEPLRAGCHQKQIANESSQNAPAFFQDEESNERHLLYENNLDSAMIEDEVHAVTTLSYQADQHENSTRVADDHFSGNIANEAGDAELQLLTLSEVVTHCDSRNFTQPCEEKNSVQSDSTLKTLHSQSDAIQIALDEGQPSFKSPLSLQLLDDQPQENDQVVELLPEISSILVPSAMTVASPKETDIRVASGTSHRRLRERELSGASQHSRCDNVSAEELAEWKNVDQLLQRKRRLFQTQTGSVESTRIPWGEEFATIQSLKRFAVQHPDILRAYIGTQLRELEGPLASNSPRKLRSPKARNASAHSGADQARSSLLLMKDLAFLLQHRLAPFFDAIVPIVIPTVFSADKRFLCETATEVLDAIILHCSGRKLALLFLQLGETYSKYEDLRLYNLTSTYIDKCVHNWSKSEVASLALSESSTELLTLLAKSLASKSAPVRISAQRSWRHLREELGTRGFKAVVRAQVPQDLHTLVQLECRDPSSRLTTSTHKRDSDKKSDARGPTIVQSSPSILQRMLLHRQNRVLPTQT